jgi:hypothetical protein
MLKTGQVSAQFNRPSNHPLSHQQSSPRRLSRQANTISVIDLAQQQTTHPLHNTAASHGAIAGLELFHYPRHRPETSQ